MKKQQVVYAFKTLKSLRVELGDELAEDLAKRQLESDPGMTGKFARPLLACI